MKTGLEKLINAVQGILDNEHIDLGDLVYVVREREGEGWDGPSVTSWSKAVTELKSAMDEARRLLEEENAQNDTRPAVTMREADLVDWKEHKEEFKKWMAQKPQRQDSMESQLRDVMVLAKFNITPEDKDTDRCWFSKEGCVIDSQNPDFWGMCVDIGKPGKIVFMPDKGDK